MSLPEESRSTGLEPAALSRIPTVCCTFTHLCSRRKDSEDPCYRGLYVDIYRHMWNRLRVMDSGNILAWLGSDQWVTASVKLSPWEIIPPWSYRHRLPGPSSVLTCRCPRALMHFIRMRATSPCSSRKGVCWKARMGLFWRVFGALQNLGQSNPSCICFLIFFLRVKIQPVLTAKQSMWKHHRKMVFEKVWLPVIHQVQARALDIEADQTLAL